tara:strand:- start:4011 stop:4517 length:507 start_codon:yes stop_codon:yes gene_type:complete
MALCLLASVSAARRKRDSIAWMAGSVVYGGKTMDRKKLTQKINPILKKFGVKLYIHHKPKKQKKRVDRDTTPIQRENFEEKKSRVSFTERAAKLRTVPKVSTKTEPLVKSGFVMRRPEDDIEIAVKDNGFLPIKYSSTTPSKTVEDLKKIIAKNQRELSKKLKEESHG